MADVNRPTDTAQKEKDINTKLQLYGKFTNYMRVASSNRRQESTLHSQKAKCLQTSKLMWP